MDIQSIVDVAFRRFSRSIEPTIRIEILLLQNAFDGLDRSAIRGCLRIDRHDAPCIDRSRIRHVIRQRRTTVHARIRRVSDRKPEALCDCQGHLLADFAFHLLAHLLRKYCKAKTIPKDLVSTAALTRFERQVAVDPQVRRLLPTFSSSPSLLRLRPGASLTRDFRNQLESVVCRRPKAGSGERRRLSARVNSCPDTRQIQSKGRKGQDAGSQASSTTRRLRRVSARSRFGHQGAF